MQQVLAVEEASASSGYCFAGAILFWIGAPAGRPGLACWVAFFKWPPSAVLACFSWSAGGGASMATPHFSNRDPGTPAAELGLANSSMSWVCEPDFTV